MAVDPRRRRIARAAQSGVRLRCPRCGQGRLFRGWFAMAAACAVCGLHFERAQGYWVGAIYVNYAVTVGLAVAGYLTLRAAFDLSTAWQLALWGTFCVVFPVWFFRYSRSLWLAIEYGVNPEH